MPNRRSRNDLLVIAVILALLGGRAGAQTAQDDPCLRDVQCQNLLASAQEASQQQRYEDALRTYQEAYSLSSAPWLLVNIGRMQQKLAHFDESIQSYGNYLATPSHPGDDDQRAAARTYLREAKAARQIPTDQRHPVYKKWWFWTLVGGAAAALVIGTAIGVSAQRPDLSGVMQYRLTP